jgi:hypothetical protein
VTPPDTVVPLDALLEHDELSIGEVLPPVEHVMPLWRLLLRMYLCKREVAKNKEQPVPQALLDLLDDRISPTCIRTFIVSIFY